MAISIKTQKLIDVLNTSVSKIASVYLFTLGTVKELRNTMDIKDDINDEYIVVKFGVTRNLSGLVRTQCKKYANLTFELKYFVRIHDIFYKKAKIDVEKYFFDTKMILRYNDSEEFAIFTTDELETIKPKYKTYFDIYGN